MQPSCCRHYTHVNKHPQLPEGCLGMHSLRPLSHFCTRLPQFLTLYVKLTFLLNKDLRPAPHLWVLSLSVTFIRVPQL